MRRHYIVLLAVVLAAGLSACHTFGGKSGDARTNAQTSPTAQEAAPVSAAGPSQLEADLRAEVAKEIASASRLASGDQPPLVRHRPYFLREYSEYPADTGFQVSLVEKDSRTKPFVAEVTIPKVRYSTRLHRSRSEAAADSKLLRDTGVETLSYEYRNGHWKRVGSLFVAQKVEENVNGEWVPAQEQLERTVAAEEQNSEGWLSRFWTNVVGR